MSKRLQVLMDERDYRELKRAARREKTTVGEWVRRALRGALSGVPRRSVEQKLAVLQKAMQGSAPTADIDQMLREIEDGYGAAGPLP